MKKQSKLWDEVASDRHWFTLSNGLTFLRLALAPVVVCNLYYEHFKIAFFIFLLAAFTDVLDGFVARLLGEQTHLGRFLDPVADKILLLASFGGLAFLHSPFFSIPRWFIYLILCRELVIVLGACFLVRVGKSATVTPMIWGKLTTFFQILFLSWIFLCYFAGWAPNKTYFVLLVLLTLFSIVSFIQYLVRGIRFLLDKPQKIG